MPIDSIRRYEHVGTHFKPRPDTRVVLLTATLSPPASAVTRSDPALRLRDYSSALSFYISLPAERFDRIILADNSDSDLTPLLDLAQQENRDKRLELLSFQANDHDPALGKAYGEFRIIDTALEASTVLGPHDHVWKCTGRLRCLNLAELDLVCSTSASIVCDLYNLPFVRSGRWNDRGRMELRLFRFQPAAYDQWIRHAPRDGPQAFDETYLYRIVLAARRQSPVCPRFPLQPEICGVSGRTQRDYQSASQRLKDTVRKASRRLAPWLWL